MTRLYSLAAVAAALPFLVFATMPAKIVPAGAPTKTEAAVTPGERAS